MIEKEHEFCAAMWGQWFGSVIEVIGVLVLFAVGFIVSFAVVGDYAWDKFVSHEREIQRAYQTISMRNGSFNFGSIERKALERLVSLNVPLPGVDLKGKSLSDANLNDAFLNDAELLGLCCGSTSRRNWDARSSL